MATTTAIIENSLQGATRRIVVEWDSGTGVTIRKQHRVPSGTNARTFADALIAHIEAVWKRAELREAVRATYAGIDPHTLTRHFATTAEMRAFVLKSIANLTREGKEGNVTKLAGAKVVLDQFTDAQIAAQLNGVSAGKVTTWRAKMNTLVSALNAYDTDFGEQEA